MLLILLAVNYESFELTLNRIFSVFTPIFYGAVIAYLCNPVYVFFQNRVLKKLKSVKWRKSLSIVLTYLVVFLVIFALLFVVVEQIVVNVQSFVQNIDEYIENAQGFLIGFINSLDFLESEEDKTPPDGTSQLPGTDTLPPDTTVNGAVTESPESTGDSSVAETFPTVPGNADERITPDSLPETTDPVTETTEEQVNLLDFSFTKEGLVRAISDFLSNSGELLNQVGMMIVSSGTATVGFIVNVFLGFIFSIYMLSEKDMIIAKAKKIVYACFKKETADSVCALGTYSDHKVGHFIKGKLIESVIVGALSYVAFLIFGIPSALMIAVIVAIMNIIPVFGPFLGAIPAAFIVLIIDPSKTIVYIIITVIIMQINGNYISPRIVGSRTGLTPLSAIAALFLMSGYFGIIGMFLGIPICAIVVEMLWAKANKRLENKNLSTDLASYYPHDALIEKEDERKPRKNLTAILVNAVIALFCKIFKVNRKNKANNDDDGTSMN
ncbi:MAG: AI-2E family transporter [Clostridia bacterium]|nr:AI-2E family transporter [Clostridia bacterium]